MYSWRDGILEDANISFNIQFLKKRKDNKYFNYNIIIIKYNIEFEIKLFYIKYKFN